MRPERRCKDLQSKTVVVVGSMDAKSLYPSCKLRESKQHIRETVKLGRTSYFGMDRKFA